MQTHIHTHAQLHSRLYSNTQTHLQIHKNICYATYIHARTHIYIHTHKHTCKRTKKNCYRACIHARTHICTNATPVAMHSLSYSLSSCLASSATDSFLDHTVFNWKHHPFVRGAYSFPTPNTLGFRKLLAEVCVLPTHVRLWEKSLLRERLTPLLAPTVAVFAAHRIKNFLRWRAYCAHVGHHPHSHGDWFVSLSYLLHRGDPLKFYSCSWNVGRGVYLPHLSIYTLKWTARRAPFFLHLTRSLCDSFLPYPVSCVSCTPFCLCVPCI